MNKYKTGQYRELAKRAVEAKEKAFAPYSNFRVGAALLTSGGKMYQGANIESPTYHLTVCAERTAAFCAFLDGERAFEAVAIASDAEDFTYPCGSCRQVLSDLLGNELEIVLVKKDGAIKTVALKDLLPAAFGEKDLQQ